MERKYCFNDKGADEKKIRNQYKAILENYKIAIKQ
jgi:hypothetical protein